jgi:hypothetical protein
MIKALIAFNILIWIVLRFGASSDQTQHDEQEQILSRATDQVGMPTLMNFQERNTLKKIIEARDAAVDTISYVVESGGLLRKICDSVGYGIPYSTQFTNPYQYWSRGATLPQADPNGLFTSPQAAGTWLNCKDPANNSLNFVYVQSNVVVSPFPLGAR